MSSMFRGLCQCLPSLCKHAPRLTFEHAPVDDGSGSARWHCVECVQKRHAAPLKRRESLDERPHLAAHRYRVRQVPELRVDTCELSVERRTGIAGGLRFELRQRSTQASACEVTGERIVNSTDPSEDVMTISRRNLFTVVSGLVVSSAAAATAWSQSKDKKEFVFKGKVEKVDQGAKSLTVANENIPGWMSAMSMTYGVDKDAVLKDVHEGDQITATVYENDFKTLYNVKVVPPDKKK